MGPNGPISPTHSVLGYSLKRPAARTVYCCLSDKDNDHGTVVTKQVRHECSLHFLYENMSVHTVTLFFFSSEYTYLNNIDNFLCERLRNIV